MSIYRNEEDYYVGTRECPQCEDQFTIDITLYKEVEYWTCPKCKQEQSRSISCQINTPAISVGIKCKAIIRLYVWIAVTLYALLVAQMKG